MSFLNSARSRRIALTASFIGAAALAAPATASADIIDDALGALPSGQISCAQAGKYWNGEADYNSKVAQANALALFDSRGPQIRNALSRVDEAANRCGLKGGGATNTAPATNNTPPANNNTPAPATGGNGGNGGAANAPAPAISLAPAGTPSYTVQVPGVGGVQLPDLFKIVQQFLGQFGIKI